MFVQRTNEQIPVPRPSLCPDVQLVKFWDTEELWGCQISHSLIPLPVACVLEGEALKFLQLQDQVLVHQSSSAPAELECRRKAAGQMHCDLLTFITEH